MEGVSTRLTRTPDTTPYAPFSTAGAKTRELCVFGDASVTAIAAVAYIKLTSHEGQTEVGFIFGKTKLAPQPGHTIPRLELCVAVLAVEIAKLIVAEMDVAFENITYYTDSKVVLGQWFSNGGTRIPRGTLEYCRGYVRFILC